MSNFAPKPPPLPVPPPLSDNGIKDAHQITIDTFDGNPLTVPERDVALGGGRLRSETMEAFDGKVDTQRINSAFDGMVDTFDQERRENDERDPTLRSQADLQDELDEKQRQRNSSLPSPWKNPKPSPFN